MVLRRNHLKPYNMKTALSIALVTLCISHSTSQTLPRILEDNNSDLAKQYWLKYAPYAGQDETGSTTAPSTHPSNAAAAKSQAVSWIPIGGSMNVYGVLESDGKPLQYNDELNAVSFIHRKSATYVTSPVATPSSAATGAIIGLVSTNMGNTWDSTCIWNNNTYYGRYPQGGIYNPPGNTSLSNAYLVATGPVSQAAGGWPGSFLASKKLDVFNNIASTAPNAQQVAPNTTLALPFSTAGKFDWPSTDFTSTDGGAVYAMAKIYANYNATSTAVQGQRGARILKGNFSAGTFNWTGDSIIPVFRQNTVTNEEMFIRGLAPQMAWNEQGTVGYVAFIGCKPGALKSNSGYQPVVYKTTNSGGTWNLMPAIDFNDTVTFQATHQHLPAAKGGTYTIPFFWYGEGMDMIVDKNDRLHFVSTLIGAAKSHPDSVGYTYRFNNFDQQTYMFGHVPGLRPYIYDFVETTSGWRVMMVDSMSSEAPGFSVGDNGYAYNPWDVEPNQNNRKVQLDARIQLSRSPDGRFIIYTWAESDSSFNSSNVKWNQYPNIKVRYYDVRNQMMSQEYNVTSSQSGASQSVQRSAYNKHVSPRCRLSYCADSTIRLSIPMTITNSQPLTQALPNTHWYSTVELSNCTVGLNERSASIHSIRLFPNPASERTDLELNLVGPQKLVLSVESINGQVLQSLEWKGEPGTNTISINTASLANGVYLIRISDGVSSQPAKLIIAR